MTTAVETAVGPAVENAVGPAVQTAMDSYFKGEKFKTYLQDVLQPQVEAAVQATVNTASSWIVESTVSQM